MRKSREKWQYGDFQTPQELAEQATSVLRDYGIRPHSVLEPTCGKGSFLLAAAKVFPHTQTFVGVDLNQTYLDTLKAAIQNPTINARTKLIHADFFYLNWEEIIRTFQEPILIIGNPPWVTSAELGILDSSNLPRKSNFQGHRGYDAVTGKSNFDISEWMLLNHIEWLAKRSGIIAVLCKTAVARKVLRYAWKQATRISAARLYQIDALKYFGASVDACFLVIDMQGGKSMTECSVYNGFEHSIPSCKIGFIDGLLISNVESYRKWKHIRGRDEYYVWRSGIKHDCSKVMELEPSGTGYQNGNNETVLLEDKYVYPMLKSSDIGNGDTRLGRKYMLVTQRYVGADTSDIEKKAPITWRYLVENEAAIRRRASSIYRNKARFPIFGVGEYSFSPWKVAISGFYKKLVFKAVGPYNAKPVVFDDTVNFLSCSSEKEANFIAGLLNSPPAQEFYNSLIFWSDKRPITIEVLKELNLRALSIQLGKEKHYLAFSRKCHNLRHINGSERLPFSCSR